MAKKSAIDKNKKRIHMAALHKEKRDALKEVIKNKILLKRIDLKQF